MSHVQYSCTLEFCCLYEPIKKDEEGSKSSTTDPLLQCNLCVSLCCVALKNGLADDVVVAPAQNLLSNSQVPSCL